jgi:hypothetical protein
MEGRHWIKSNRYVFFSFVIFLIARPSDAVRTFNEAFAASVYSELTQMMAFPWVPVANIASLFDTRWQLAYTGDNADTSSVYFKDRNLMSYVNDTEALRYAWTLFKPLFEGGLGSSLDMLYMGFEDGKFLGYLSNKNTPGTLVYESNVNMSCASTFGYDEMCRLSYAGRSTNNVTGIRDGPPSSGKRYDPRIRPWYTKAMSASSGLAWSDPYVFIDGVSINISYLFPYM